MKKKLFLFAIAILCFTEAYSIISFPPSIQNYRWRNDDGNQTTATWKALENDSIFQKGEGKVRLRMEIVTSGLDLTKSTGLYYKITGDTIDTLMHLVSNDINNAFVFATSSHIVDGEPTTQQLTISNTLTNAAGFVKENHGFFNFSIINGERKELEFCIKASPKANFNNIMYNFILAGEDSTGFFYLNIPSQDSIMPTIVLQKTTLTVKVNDASRKYGQVNPEFTVSYTGFVDGDDASVLDSLPKIITSASSSSAAGNYDVVPYGAYDNKYTFIYENGTLTVTSPTNDLGINNADRLSVYPNPATQLIYIKGNIPLNAIAKIYDLSGRVLMEQYLDIPTIDISKLNSGNYILKINDTIFRIVKE